MIIFPHDRGQRVAVHRSVTVVGSLTLSPTYPDPSAHNLILTMATQSKIPWDKLKADTLRAICRDFGANPGKRKREGMLEFLRAVETTGRASPLRPPHYPAVL